MSFECEYQNENRNGNGNGNGNVKYYYKINTKEEKPQLNNKRIHSSRL